MSVTIHLSLTQFENHERVNSSSCLARSTRVGSPPDCFIHGNVMCTFQNRQKQFELTYITQHYNGVLFKGSSLKFNISLCFVLQVYAVGGYDGQSRLSSVECYDSFSNRWTEVAPMKEAVSSPAVISCVNKLFVIGGGPDDNTCSDKVCRRV